MEKIKKKLKTGTLLERIENRFYRFRDGQSGMELLQLAIVIVISVGLIAVVTILATNVGSQIESAAEDVASFSGWQYGG